MSIASSSSGSSVMEAAGAAARPQDLSQLLWMSGLKVLMMYWVALVTSSTHDMINIFRPLTYQLDGQSAKEGRGDAGVAVVVVVGRWGGGGAESAAGGGARGRGSEPGGGWKLLSRHDKRQHQQQQQ